MNANLNTKISKYLSYILRHRPDSIGLELDNNGWASIAELIAKTTTFKLTAAILNVIVETNDKQRFIISSDGLNIRANQGHSIDVDLQLVALKPPNILFHGTATRFIPSIDKMGLTKQNRHHVHLSENKIVAEAVGKRHGTLVLLCIDAKKMHDQAHDFYKTKNNVWLVEHVPNEFISKI